MSGKILALSGGVGGAKLALGLSQVLAPDDLMIAVNVADDFEHLGLHISPDLDSVTYALAGQNNQELGWGRAGESWHFIEALTEFGGESWFRLGDKDLALHVQRSEMLKANYSLSQVTEHISQSLGITHEILPISNDPVRTIVQTEGQDLNFQHYFVRERCRPVVKGFHFAGIEEATLNPLVERWLDGCDGIIICPSNPFVSVDPVINIPGFREAAASIPTIAVSPIIEGQAIKGPAAKMMGELDMPTTASAVADHYGDFLSGFVLDRRDAGQLGQLHLPAIATDSVMVTLSDRVALARDCLEFLETLR